ncbi:hypothetical protein RB195_000040 [Necator americanus]|uniref:Uncharacterized protein n=1 Tax=Necator americanus TaxID=51031 RepID=A0ABR1D7P0_NECAM
MSNENEKKVSAKIDDGQLRNWAPKLHRKRTWHRAPSQQQKKLLCTTSMHRRLKVMSANILQRLVVDSKIAPD